MPVKQPITLGRAAQRSFEHLIETGKKQDRRLVPRRVQHKPAWVNPKDRIAIWNIGPGDRAQVIAGSKKGKIGTVDWVDRTMNRVYFRENDFAVSLAKHSYPKFLEQHSECSSFAAHKTSTDSKEECHFQ